MDPKIPVAVAGVSLVGLAIQTVRLRKTRKKFCVAVHLCGELAEALDTMVTEAIFDDIVHHYDS